MTSDCIKCQSWRICCLSCNRTVWYKSQFNQSLESITDTKCKSVTLIYKSGYRIFDFCILECSCKEFCRTIRFITCGKATWEHNNLSLIDCFFKNFN